MTKPLDAAVRAGCDTAPDCAYPECLKGGWTRMPCRDHARQSIKTLHAALPEEVPEWFSDGWWWNYGWVASTQARDAWRDLRTNILGQDA